MDFNEANNFFRQHLELLLEKTEFTVIESSDRNFTESEAESLGSGLPQREGPISIQTHPDYPKFIIIRGRFNTAEIKKILPNIKFELNVYKGNRNPRLPFPYEYL